MGVSNKIINWNRGPRVAIDDEPVPPPTIESLTDKRDAAHHATDAALADVSDALAWDVSQCLAAAAGQMGWPEYVEIDTLAAIIRFQDCLAAEHDAEATLRTFQARSEASQP